MIQIILSIIVISAFLFLIFISYFIARQAKQSKDMRLNAKKGDPCYYYIHQERRKGTIDEYGQYYSFVRDENNVKHRVYSSEIYPVFNYKYQ